MKKNKEVMKYVFEGDLHVVTDEPYGYVTWKVKDDGSWERKSEEAQDTLEEIRENVESVAESIVEYDPKGKNKPITEGLL